MFLLNTGVNNNFRIETTFTIQNVSIKLLAVEQQEEIERHLKYKMFLLNDNNKIDDYFQNKHLQYKMFLLNILIKKSILWNHNYLQYKMFLLNEEEQLKVFKEFRHLQYKMFLLNEDKITDFEAAQLFTIQNVSIK